MLGDSHQENTKLVQIFRYLQALHQLRNPLIRAIQEQPWVMWFHDLPDHPCIRKGNSSTANNENQQQGQVGDDFILKVSRPRVADAPPLPKELSLWVQNGWQDIDGKITVIPDIQKYENNQLRIEHFSDDPQRMRALDSWKARREAWIEAERPALQALKLYERLYALYTQLGREGERFELLVGDGVVFWKPTNNHVLNHPVLLLHVQLHFDPQIPEFTVIETDQTPELYTAIFQNMAGVSANEIATSRLDFEQNRWHPLGGTETAKFLQRLITQVSSRGEFLDQKAAPRNVQFPSIRRDPVLFLRSRTMGISTALETILEVLPTSEKQSYALTSLVGLTQISNERQFESSSLSLFDSPNGEDETILLSKPANTEQLEIAHRLEKYGAVLVQGPPGTGKTHTIANLIGHLLAQGKSVLVTSEKPKALRVLKEKVVEPLQPLCVSILEDDSRKEMESTIDAISERLSFANAIQLEHEARVLTETRTSLLQQLRETRQRLIEARGSEYRTIGIAGETYTPSEAARFIAHKKDDAGWLPGPVAPGSPLPLSMKEFSELYHSNTSISAKDEFEVRLFHPDAGKLLSPIDFERLVTTQQQNSAIDMHYRRDLWVTSSVSSISTRGDIKQLHVRLLQEIGPLQEQTGWRLAAIMAGREGGIALQVWNDLINEIEGVYALARQSQVWLYKYDVFIPPDCLNQLTERTLTEILEHMTKGGKLSGFSLLMHQTWKQLLGQVRVNGKGPENTEHIEALRHYLRLILARQELTYRWLKQMTPLGGPQPGALGPQPEVVCYQYTAPLKSCLQWYTTIWKPLEQELKAHGFQWERFLAEIPVNHSQYGHIMRLRTAVVEILPSIITAEAHRRLFNLNEAKFAAMEQSLEQRDPGTEKAEIVYYLRDAIKRRDPQAYRKVYQNLNDLQAKIRIAQARRTLLAKLERVAPAWAAAIQNRAGIHGESSIPGNLQEAWLWRQLYEELDRRAKLSLEELQERIIQLSRELFDITTKLVEYKAWAAQVRRTSLEQQRALQGWRELVRKAGKGTGKRAPRLLAEARRLMPVCQSAVPVWIMPLSHVARNFDMKRNHFDVVIIDEASQADITALMAVFLGSQVVIVGDHEQVSPMAVGQNLDDVNHLIDEHLRGIPLANMYDGKLSIYELARTTFHLTCLREHFRCVPPIIQFSNELSYEGKIKPLRDNSEVKRRPATIAYQVKSSTKNVKVNEEEAITTASLLLACSEQPEYQDASFGVISLLGTDQAIYIETLLRRYMSPTAYIKHQVLCGDPAQFQGDERDVMFLSMVDTPEGTGPLGLRTGEGHDDMFKKRYNVAASRARDQMWVIYSLDTDVDLKQHDIRRRLILHARDQEARNRAVKVQAQKIESEFERQVLERLVQAGYRVTTQWPVGTYRIDMVVEGQGKRLAVECDGDRYHTQEHLEADMARQAILERLGWRFVRIRGSQFFRNPQKAMESVFTRLQGLGIPPEGMQIETHAYQDDEELKGRIVRRAEELRYEWQTKDNAAVPQPLARRARHQNNLPSQEDSLLLQNSENTPMPFSSHASQQRVGHVNQSQPVDPSRINQSHSSSTSLKTFSANIVVRLAQKGLKVVDKRASGGCLWVIGGTELQPIMNELKEQGISFTFTPRGSETSGYRPAWYTKG